MSQPQSRYTQQNPNPLVDRSVKVPEVIQYICGDCGAQTAMQPSEFIRCKECGHRVMYKPRTTRSESRTSWRASLTKNDFYFLSLATAVVQFEAR
ncbi:hypothetical protein IAR50_006315 [Cryptococcus sp. DSM 104548]